MSRLTNRITLYCRRGTSDKVYHVEIIKRGRGFVVNIAYGRRGGPLRTATKTPNPVPRDRARKIYANLVLDKAGSGYTNHAPKTAPPTRPPAKQRAPKDPVWRHPDLGRFTYDGSAWRRTIPVAAFKAFKYGTRPPTARCTLSFEVDDEHDLPTPAAVAVAARVLANQHALVARVLAALWDDFTGRGPDSGEFWHNDLAAVADAVLDSRAADTTPPQSADDLPRLIGHPDITVRKRVHRHDKPVAELGFAAAFDEEHGLGLLTDGRTILGIGRSSDVYPFKRPRQAPRRRPSSPGAR